MDWNLVHEKAVRLVKNLIRNETEIVEVLQELEERRTGSATDLPQWEKNGGSQTLRAPAAQGDRGRMQSCGDIG